MRKLPLIYRALMALFPAEFRREYGRELSVLLAEKDRDAAAAGWRVRIRTRARESAALARACVRTRALSRGRISVPRPRLAQLVDDVRFTLRSHRKNLSLTAVLVGTIAFGIGANTTLFRITDQLLLRPLPVHQPEQLVLLSAPGPWSGWRRGSDTLSYPAYENLRDENHVFDGVLARYRTSLTLEREENPERVTGVLVSGNYFEVLGVGAELGRVLVPEDDRSRAGNPVVVLSHSYWRDRFGADPSIVGGTVRLNRHPMTVLGVARRGFHGVEVARAPDVFVPLSMKPLMTPTWDHLDNRRSNFLHVFARLREGIAHRQAAASMEVLYRTVLERDLAVMPPVDDRFREEYRTKPLFLKPGFRGVSNLRERYQTALLILHAMLGLVLLIVCANVAHLLVTRSAVRRKEIAVHLALGASRFALSRRAVIESLGLALSGGLLGMVLSSWTSGVVVAALPVEGARRAFSTEPDLRILGFALLLSVLAGLIFGLVPAFQSSRTSLASTMKDESAVGAGRGSLGKVLAIAQIALSLLLLMGAGLFGRSLYNLTRADVGFETENLVSFDIDPPQNGYRQDGLRTLLRELLRELGRLPGVTRASAADVSAFTTERTIRTIRVQGRADAEFEDRNIHLNAVSPGYFRTLGMSLLRGRDIAETDRAGAPKVAVINEPMARYFFGDENPVGERFRLGPGEEFDIEVIGLVPGGKYMSLKEEELRFAFLPYPQAPRLSDVTFYLRTAMGGSSIEDVRGAVRAVDPSLPVFGMRPLEARVDETLYLDRAVAVLSAMFGLLACLLAAMGLYGVMSSTVTRRTREIGLRMALGADRGNVLRMVLNEVCALAALGLLAGIPAGLGLGRLVSSQLFELSAWDPLTLAAATALSVGVAIVSGFLPARRASRLDPVRALRWE